MEVVYHEPYALTTGPSKHVLMHHHKGSKITADDSGTLRTAIQVLHKDDNEIHLEVCEHENAAE